MKNRAPQSRAPQRRKRGGGPQSMMPGEKAKDFKGTMRTLLKYLKPHTVKLVIVLICAIASTVFNIVSPAILGLATDRVVTGLRSGGVDYESLLVILGILLALYGLSLLFGVIQGWLMAGVSQKVIYTFRDEMSKKLNRLPLKYFDSTTHGELQSRMVNDIETVNQALSTSITQMITSFVTLVGILIMMLRISVIMTLAALLIIPASMAVIRVVVAKSQGHFRAQQEYLGHVNGHVEEMYGGHDVIKAFNREEISIEEFEAYNDKLCESGWKSQFLSGLMMPMTQFIGNLAFVMVCLLGGYFAIIGRISIGDIQAFIQYVRNFNHPITQVANIVNLLQSTAAAAERIFDLIEEEEEEDPAVEDPAGESSGLSGQTQPAFASGEVSFEHVRFGYKPEEPVIKDFSFTAKPGQSIAIVGPTGAGKTTIVKLMMRFYELDGGRILVDGKDIRDYSRQDLRRMFGMVLQDTWLHSGTVRENIRYGRTVATDEEVEAAAKAAHIDFFIRTQPKGYDLEINEEANNISAGQKQLLTIARAILSDSPIMILDEATSSVDTRTEQQIQNAMDHLMEGRTSFVIAHRLSTIRGADHILVMDHGDIVEQGNHEELMARGGFYARLYNSQFAE
ncbi:MAG: ABC transporter ATP-binding protein [Firmicutes bacterium]|nr:ABC transporter ATP-binding protein [Bacillota bacterium]